MPPVPATQRQFCATYREDQEQHQKYEKKIADAKGNPILIENIKKEQPEFAKMLHARQAEVMGDGSFKDWTGMVHMTISTSMDHQRYSSPIQSVAIQVEFPCIWTNYGYAGSGGRLDYSKTVTEGRCDYSTDPSTWGDGKHHQFAECGLFFGNDFRENYPSSLPIEVIPLASAFGQSLGGLPPDEPVAVTGKLFCDPDKGCEFSSQHGPGHLYANITSLRSLKTGKPFGEPVPAFQTLSQPTPFIPAGDDTCLEPNKERLDREADLLKRAEANLLSRYRLPEGTRYAAVKDSKGAAVTIEGGSVPYGLAMIGDNRFERCVLLANGVPASLMKHPVKPVELPHQTNPKDGLAYLLLQPGTVTVPPARTNGRSEELTISRGFWIGQTEVTQEAYERVTGTNPSQFKGPKLPVESITWTEAKSYCQAVGMRLPSDLEWEYAAALEKPLASYGGNDDAGWFGSNADRRTHDVAQKDPNRWGLYDMLGNVAEFVADLDARLHLTMRGDPAKLASAGMGFMRGGSWSSPEAWGYGHNDGRWSFAGVRCAGNSLPGVSGAEAPSSAPVRFNNSTPNDSRQRVKVCSKQPLYLGRPRPGAITGSGRVVGTTDPGDEPVLLEKGERVSKVEFEVPGEPQKVVGWLANSAFCAASSVPRP